MSLRTELHKLGVAPKELQLIREKFGIAVFRVTHNGQACVGKHFGKGQRHGRKEIAHYAMLQSIGVPTLRLVAHTENLVLLEDIEASETHRLGTEEDMSDSAVARLIAQWFRQLHTCGKAFDGLAQLDVLDNADELNVAGIQHAMRKTNTRGNPFWSMLLHDLAGIQTAHARLCNTITYNDFWWDNMAVARDDSSALMFDYNCVYRGYAYSDIRHILSVLTKDAGAAFLAAYGSYSAEEKAFEDVFFPLTGLISACRAKTPPAWAAKFEAMLHSGELTQRLRALKDFL